MQNNLSENTTNLKADWGAAADDHTSFSREQNTQASIDKFSKIGQWQFTPVAFLFTKEAQKVDRQHILPTTHRFLSSLSLIWSLWV